MKLSLWFTLLISSATLLRGQNSLQLDYGQGELLKHTSNLGGLGTVRVRNFNADYLFNTKGRYYWSDWHRHPFLGFTYSASFYDNPALGHSHALIAFWRLEFPFAQRFAFYAHAGMGLGYVAEKFDINTNRFNQSVGTHLNQAVDLRLGLRARLYQDWQLHLHARFLHFSNNGLKKPNYGINLPYLGIGIARRWDQKKTSPPPEKPTDTAADLLLSLQLGSRQIAFQDPYTFAGFISLDYRYPINQVLKIGLGLSIFDDGLRYEHKKYLAGRIPDYQELSYLQSLALGSHLGLSVAYGKFQVFGSLGYYYLHPHRKNRQIQNLPSAYRTFMDYQNAFYLYSHLGFRYQILNRTLLNWALKIELNKALYASLGISQKIW